MNNAVRRYLTGFAASLLLTLIAFACVTEKLVTGTALLTVLATTAIAQVYVQLVFFLHLNHESRPRWQSYAFGFMTIVVIIVVFGSIWIMNNLHYNMMPGSDVTEFIQYEENIDHETQH